MIGFESFNHGGSSSSSNLSPLAQPFTVNRSHFEPNPTLLAQFRDTPYSFAFNPSLDNWSHSNPSTSIHDTISNSNLGVDSIRPTVLPSPSDYGYFGAQSISSSFTHMPSINPIMMTATTGAFPYGQQSGATTTNLAESPSYYTYPGPLITDGDASIGFGACDSNLSSTSSGSLLDGSSQAVYSQSLSDSGYATQCGGFWNGLFDAEHGRKMNFGGSFCWEEKNGFGSFNHSFFPEQGGPAIESLSTCEDNSVVLDKNCDCIVGMRSQSGSEGSEQIDAKCSCVTQENQKVDPFSNARKSVLGPNLILQEMSYPQISSTLSATYYGDNLHPDTISYGRWFPRSDSCKIKSTEIYSSSAKSSPSVVLGPTDIATCYSEFNKISSDNVTSSSKAVHAFSKNESSAGVSPSPEESCIQLNDQVREGGRKTIQIRNVRERNDRIHVKPSTMNTDQPFNNTFFSGDALNHLSKESYKLNGSQSNHSYGLTLAPCGAETGNFVDNSSGTLDQFNPAVDSPCWKGASASHQYPFGFSGALMAQSSAASEAVTPQLLVKELQECDSMKIQGPQIFPVSSDDAAAVVPSYKLQGNVFYHQGVSLEDASAFSNVPSSGVSFHSTAQRQNDAVKEGYYGSKFVSGNQIHFSDGYQDPSEEYWLPNNTSTNSEFKPSNTTQPSIELCNTSLEQQLESEASTDDTSMDIKDDVQVSSLNMPFSPRLQKGSSSGVSCRAELNELLGVTPNSSVEYKPQKRNVQMLLDAIHSLSDFLLSSCSNDADLFQEQDHEVLQHVINLLKKVQQKSSLPELQLRQPDASNQSPSYSLGGTGLCKDAGICQSKLSSMAETCNVQSQHGHLSVDKGGKMQYSMYGKKDDILQDFVCSNGDADIGKDNDMIEAIKKVLEQNVHDEEDIYPQSLLYKNLWLDAEAALCAMKYKAHLGRMKIEMERCKLHQGKDMPVKPKVMSLRVSSDINMAGFPTSETKEGPTKVISTSDETQSSFTSQAEDVEASIIARARVLKDRLETKGSLTHDIPTVNPTQLSITNQPEDVEASVMARFRILRDRVDSSTPMEGEGRELPNLDDFEPSAGIGEKMSGLSLGKIKDTVKKPHYVKAIKLGPTGNGNPWPFIRDKTGDGSSEVTKRPVMQHLGTNNTEGNASGHVRVKDFHAFVPDEQTTSSYSPNKTGDGLQGGEYDSPSSDWEHVLKEELAWHK